MLEDEQLRAGNAAGVQSRGARLSEQAPDEDSNVENRGPKVEDLWLDHGSDRHVEDSHLYNTSPWLTPPQRRLSPGAEEGDWAHLDVYFDRPFLTPPVVLLTARDSDGDPKLHANPLALIAQNVTTHGFTVAARNTDTAQAEAKFHWVALGCNAGCG